MIVYYLQEYETVSTWRIRGERDRKDSQLADGLQQTIFYNVMLCYGRRHFYSII